MEEHNLSCQRMSCMSSHVSKQSGKFLLCQPWDHLCNGKWLNFTYGAGYTSKTGKITFLTVLLEESCVLGAVKITNMVEYSLLLSGFDRQIK